MKFKLGQSVLVTGSAAKCINWAPQFACNLTVAVHDGDCPADSFCGSIYNCALFGGGKANLNKRVRRNVKPSVCSQICIGGSRRHFTMFQTSVLSFNMVGCRPEFSRWTADDDRPFATSKHCRFSAWASRWITLAFREPLDNNPNRCGTHRIRSVTTSTFQTKDRKIKSDGLKADRFCKLAKI